MKYSSLGLFLEEFPSISCAAKSIGSTSRDIQSCCKNNINKNKCSHKGFIWKFKNGNNIIEKQIKPEVSVRYIPVCQFTKDGKFIREFPSVKEAAEYMGKNTDSISKCCRGNQPQAHGFVWKYVDNEYVNDMVAKSKSNLTNKQQIKAVI